MHDFFFWATHCTLILFAPFSLARFFLCFAHPPPSRNFSYLTLFTGICRRLKFNTPIQGFALQGHVLKNLSIEEHASCKNLCTMESRCVSFNLGPSIKNKMVCELSDSDHTKRPEDLKPREGFVYRSTEVRNPKTVQKLEY